MEKLKPVSYRGIDYILLKDLPNEQKKIFLTWANEDTIFKIQHNETLIKDCILFSDYIFWYDNILSKTEEFVPVKNNSMGRRNLNLALD